MPVLEQVLEQYPEKVKVVFKQFPLNNHQFAMKAATAVLAAQTQGKFWELHDLLFENYNKLSDDTIKKLALSVGLSEKQYDTLMKDPELQKKVRKDYMDGRRAEVRGTPSIFINGIKLRNMSLAGFQEAIDKRLEKLNTASAESSP